MNQVLSTERYVWPEKTHSWVSRLMCFSGDTTDSCIILILLLTFANVIDFLSEIQQRQGGRFMKQKTLEFLTNNHSETPSMWREKAQWRRDNWSWLRHSQKIAVRVLLQMKQLGLIQKALAERMNCTQQYISKILKGKENMSLDTLSKLERALGITLILDEEYDNLPIGMVAEDMPPILDD